MEITHIYLDMDGVLADFMPPALRLHNRHDLISAKQLPYATWDAMGITAEEFWAPINQLGITFWETLPLLPNADRYIESVKCSGLRWSILTSPSRSWDDCVVGKHRWLRRHYGPWVASKMIAYTNKDDLSGVGRLLIDDCDKNCELWRQAGGLALSPQRQWNSGGLTDDDVIESILAWGEQ